MSLFLENIDQWYEEFEVASPKDQYEQLVEIISTPIDPAYADETEIAYSLIDQQAMLESHGLLDDALSFTALLQEQQPVFYQKEFCYFDNFLIRYDLFHQEDERMDEALSRYQQDPTKAIDRLSPVLDELCFYNARAKAVQLSRKVYTPVKTSPKLFSGSEAEFMHVILADFVEQAYQQLQQGDTVDWDTFETEATEFGLNCELLPLITTELSGQGESSDDLIARFRKE